MDRRRVRTAVASWTSRRSYQDPRAARSCGVRACARRGGHACGGPGAAAPAAAVAVPTACGRLSWPRRASGPRASCSPLPRIPPTSQRISWTMASRTKGQRVQYRVAGGKAQSVRATRGPATIGEVLGLSEAPLLGHSRRAHARHHLRLPDRDRPRVEQVAHVHHGEPGGPVPDHHRPGRHADRQPRRAACDGAPGPGRRARGAARAAGRRRRRPAVQGLAVGGPVQPRWATRRAPATGWSRSATTSSACWC